MEGTRLGQPLEGRKLGSSSALQGTPLRLWAMVVLSRWMLGGWVRREPWGSPAVSSCMCEKGQPPPILAEYCSQ